MFKALVMLCVTAVLGQSEAAQCRPRASNFQGSLGSVGDCCATSSQCQNDCCYEGNMCQLSLLCKSEETIKLGVDKSGLSSAISERQKVSAIAVISISGVLILVLIVASFCCCRKEKAMIDDENDVGETPERYRS